MMRSRRAVAITVCMLLITACCGLTLLSPQGSAQAGSAGGTSGGGDSGDGTGRGTSVSSGRSAGMGTDAPGAGMTAGGFGRQTANQASGGMSPGPVPGYYGGIAGRGEPNVPGTGESFQQNRYGVTGPMEVTFNEYQQYRHAGTTTGQYPQGPIADTGPGKVTSLQATGIGPGTCMWDCTASYTPTECRQLCP